MRRLLDSNRPLGGAGLTRSGTAREAADPVAGFGKIFDLVRGSLVPVPVRPDGADPKPTRSTGSLPPSPRDVLPFRPDPSVMYVLGEVDPGPRAGPEEGLGPVADVVRAPGMRLQARWRAFERLVSRAERDQAKRLCRLLAPSDWVALYAAFTGAVVEAVEARPERWRLRDQNLPAGWFKTPWYALRPGDLDHDARDVLDRVRRLGFENVFLQEDFAGRDPFVESIVDAAGSSDLRVVMGLELAQTALAGLPRDARFLREVLGLLAREMNLGILGAEAHHPERWSAILAGDARAHAFFGLMKLFMHLVGPREIAVPDLDVPVSDAISWFGGWVQLGGEPFSAEGDLIRWREGTEALGEAVRSGSRRPIEAALSNVPAVGHHGSFLVSLQEPDDPVLAAALLYFLPATPLVEHAAASAYLAELNGLRKAKASLRGGRLIPLDLPDDRTLAWARCRPDSESLLLAANLHAEERCVALDARALTEVMDVPLEAGDVLQAVAGDPEPTRRWVAIPKSGRLELLLPPRSHIVLSSPIRAERAPFERAA